MDDSLMFTHFNTFYCTPCLVHVYIVFNPNPSGKDDKGPLLHLHDLERRRNLLAVGQLRLRMRGNDMIVKDGVWKFDKSPFSSVSTGQFDTLS